jgi:Reverse transcriptase (RNA-dependent DNA polymerase)
LLPQQSGRAASPAGSPVAGPATRRLDRLPPQVEEAYVAAVSGVAQTIERALSTAVLAHRLADPARLRLYPWAPSRDRFRARATFLAATARVVLLTDVRRCYPSISASAVERALFGLGCRARETGIVLEVLNRCMAEGIVGLPVGPRPSAVLANAVLSVGDRALTGQGLPFVRWVDDVLVAAPSPEAAGGARAALGEAIAGMGLQLHRSKTRIVDPSEALRVIGRYGSHGSRA